MAIADSHQCMAKAIWYCSKNLKLKLKNKLFVFGKAFPPPCGLNDLGGLPQVQFGFNSARSLRPQGNFLVLSPSSGDQWFETGTLQPVSSSDLRFNYCYNGL